jgi:carboxypeptidase C (cathepsin A)
MSKWRSAGIIVLGSVCGAAYTGERPRAQEPPHAVEKPGPAAVLSLQLCRIDIKGEKKDRWMRLPKPESSVTERRLGVGGKSIDYTATAGALIIRDDEDKPFASIGYVAYTGSAAVTWYHHMLPIQPAALEPFLTEMRTFAAGPFTAALLKGDALSEAEREAVVEKMHEYTGLSADYLNAANLRVSEIAFAHELLKAQRKTVGRLDGRFVGPTMDSPEKYTDYDPQSAAIRPAFVAAFLDYYHGDLKFGRGSV